MEKWKNGGKDSRREEKRNPALFFFLKKIVHVELEIYETKCKKKTSASLSLLLNR
jgi:hypothetical protein